jgi:hypothetical protein
MRGDNSVLESRDMAMSNGSTFRIFQPITSALAAGAAGLAVAALIAATTLAVAPQRAEALPAYAQQTGLPCGQCHVNPAGSGPLKAFGKKFQANGHKLK